jgi:VWFA-related protein
MMRRTAVCVICSLGFMTAQNVPFRVQTKVVLVPVSVTDKHGRYVDGLTARDFNVRDDGALQEVTMDDFGTGLAPVSLVIAIQTSGISMPALAKIRQIGGMIKPLVTAPRGEVAVVAFDEEIQWLQDFTRDDENIRQAVRNLKPGSALRSARMLDAIADVADRMRPRKGRKMLLLISETRDRGSKTTVQQALDAVEREGIEVFGAHYSTFATALIAKPGDLPDVPPPPPALTSADPSIPPDPYRGGDVGGLIIELARLGKTNVIQALTTATGGSDYPFLKERGIENAIEKLGAEVHSQYILSFPQRDNTPGPHLIEVSVANRNGLRIRSRRTYWADQNGGTQ